MSDYESISLNITLRGGGLESQDIMIPIRDDNRVEETENFSVEFVVLQDSGNIPVFDPTQANVQILDDDGEWDT